MEDVSLLVPSYLDHNRAAQALFHRAGYLKRPPKTDLNDLVERLGGEIRYDSLEVARKEGVFCTQVEDLWGGITSAKTAGRQFTIWVLRTASRGNISPERAKFVIGHELGELAQYFFRSRQKLPVVEESYKTSEQERLDWPTRSRQVWCNEFPYYVLLDPRSFRNDMMHGDAHFLRGKYGLSLADTLFAAVAHGRVGLGALEGRLWNSGKVRRAGLREQSDLRNQLPSAPPPQGLPSNPEADNGEWLRRSGRDRLCTRASWAVKVAFHLLHDSNCHFGRLLERAWAKRSVSFPKDRSPFAFCLKSFGEDILVNVYPQPYVGRDSVLLVGKKTTIQSERMSPLFSVPYHLSVEDSAELEDLQRSLDVLSGRCQDGSNGLPFEKVWPNRGLHWESPVGHQSSASLTA